mgnify:CR=1 FL=1
MDELDLFEFKIVEFSQENFESENPRFLFFFNFSSLHQVFLNFFGYLDLLDLSKIFFLKKYF